MSTSSVSSSYLSTMLLPTMSQTDSALTKLEVEESTGQYADIGLQLGSQSGYELSLKNEYGVLQSLTDSNTVVTMNMTSAQDALDSMLTQAQSTQTSLVTWTSSSTTSASTLQTLGVTGLQTLISSANTASNGEYVFGGENTSVAPMADYSSVTSTVDQAFQDYFGFSPTSSSASSITASQMESFLSGPYADLFSGSGWTTNFSSASSTNTSAEISPGTTVDTSSTANQSAFQELTQGYAMLAVFGGSSLSTSAQEAVASAATSLISQGVSSTTASEASVGASLAQVSDATDSMASQMTFLQTQIGSLDDVNSSKISTQITTLSTQLETAYELTSELQKLSLAQYLPSS